MILPAEWSEFAPDVDAILVLEREKNAVILAHDYQTPEIEAPEGGEETHDRKPRLAAPASSKKGRCAQPMKATVN